MYANQEQTSKRLDNLKIAIATTVQIATVNEEKCKERLRSRSPSADTPRDISACNEIANDMNEDGNLLVFMDWDDTLFPTSFIVEMLHNKNTNGFITVCDEHVALLNKLGALTLTLLTGLIKKYGAKNIHIVSNSVAGWIGESLCVAACISKVYKQIETLLNKNKITMDSAQTMYAENNTLQNGTPILWKQLCFDAILNGNKTKSKYSHILSIGDQWCDHHSVKQSINALASYSPLHHIIKLKITPGLNDMINEILYVQTCFHRIFNLITPKSVRKMVFDYHREEIQHFNCNYYNRKMH